jgi:chorismate synthase
MAKLSHTPTIPGGFRAAFLMDRIFTCKVAFKPVATIMKDQDSVDADGAKTTVSGKGRHDPCVVPRAVPIVEAMAALVIADFLFVG